MEQELSEHGETVLAFDELVDRCMGNLDLAERVLTRFEQSFAGDLQQLEDLLRAESSEQIALIAHRLKGASANVGAPSLRDATAKIESLARAGRMDKIPPCVEELRGQWLRFVESVNSLDRSI